MKTLRHAAAFALIASFAAIGSVAHAENAISAAITGNKPTDPSSYIPLVIFVVAAAVVYLCNRPRSRVIYARARRRSDSSRRD